MTTSSKKSMRSVPLFRIDLAATWRPSLATTSPLTFLFPSARTSRRGGEFPTLNELTSFAAM